MRMPPKISELLTRKIMFRFFADHVYGFYALRGDVDLKPVVGHILDLAVNAAFSRHIRNDRQAVYRVSRHIVNASVAFADILFIF